MSDKLRDGRCIFDRLKVIKCFLIADKSGWVAVNRPLQKFRVAVNRPLQKFRIAVDRFLPSVWAFSLPDRVLWSELELDVAYLDDVAVTGGERFTGGLLIDVGAVGAARVLHVPDAVAVPEAGVLAGYEAV